MATLLLEHISTLVTCRSGPLGRRSGREMEDIGLLHDASVLVEDGRITLVEQELVPAVEADERIDCSGRTVIPGFVDSHTHMVFAGNRADEFARRLRGATYQEIAAAGGGILSSMRSVREASVEEIVEQSRPRVRSAFRHGSTTIEVKSGYGLDTESEMKLLEAIAILDREEAPTLVPTFLGAHDVPPEHREQREGYIAEIIDRMIPLVAERGLARFCDVFSDTGYYTVEESERIFEAAMEHGFELKVHADELSSFGGAELASRVGALSADHLLRISDDGIEQMRERGVIGTLLPGTAFFLGLPYAPARRMIERGMAVALATDCNPGSNLCENMQMTIALACMGMRMTMEEAITAATINGAAALGLDGHVGSIEPGKEADMLILDTADYPSLIYHYGVNHVETVIKGGSVHRFG